MKVEVQVGAPRVRPEISDLQQFQEREQESDLSTCIVDVLPPEIINKLSRQCSRRSESKASSALPPRDGEKVSGSRSFQQLSRAGSGPKQHRVNTQFSVDSQLDFAESSQTIIIFDWDDTLCPSTCMRPMAQFDRQGRLKAKLGNETRNELKMLSDIVVPLIRLAQTMGKVIMVTNAKAPWVDISCSNFLPAVQEILKEVPVIYALELVKANGLDGFDKETGCMLTETKARAMREAVSQFYSRYPGQSWKNIVSIGDAYFEHDAIRQVVRENGQEKPCRTKTIKLLEGPTTAGMVVQLSIINGWLPQIVRADADVDIDLSADEERVNKWVAMYGDLHE